MPYPIPLFDEKILTLTDTHLIGTGGNRYVYVHPDNPDLCLKINGKNRYPGYPRENETDIWGYEIEGLLKKTQDATAPIWRHLPRMHGWQATNVGDGLIFDYYHRADGAPAPTLDIAIQERGYTPEIESAVDALVSYVRKNKLWIRDLAFRNIVLADDGHLKLIDSVGTRKVRWKRYIPLSRKYRVEKKIYYMKKRINKLIT